MVLLCCSVVEETSSFDWMDFLQNMGPIIVGVVAIVYTNRQSKANIIANEKQHLATLNASNKQHKENIVAKMLEEERQEIYKKLNEFYGPFYQLRKKSNLLYDKMKAKYKEKDKNFRTLVYLLEGKTFDSNDEIILKEILKIGEQCETLIHEKAGLIDDDNLRNNLIPKATTHYLILRLAKQGVLSGEEEKYKDFVFPIELDDALEKRKKELEKRLSELNKSE